MDKLEFVKKKKKIMINLKPFNPSPIGDAKVTTGFPQK